MSVTTNLGLPFIEAAQAQKHVTHNDALLALDAICQSAVLDRDLSTAPASPAEGQRWLVGPNTVGAWAGKAGSVAAWQDGGWRLYAPKAGWIVFVVDELALAYFNGQAWIAMSVGNALQNLALLGVGTTADAVNPFSFKGNNLLLAAKRANEGGDGDLRAKLSKEAPPDVLSLLFQTGFSARAELGLLGDDRFRLKVSPNGQAFVDALVAQGDGSLNYPSQPRCSMVGFTITGAGPLYMASFTTARHNARGCYSSATGRFTAPVAGDYEFRVSMVHVGTETVALFLYKNGVNQTRLVYLNALPALQYRQAIGFASMPLQAGDYIEIMTDAVPGNWFTSEELFNVFFGQLLG